MQLVRSGSRLHPGRSDRRCRASQSQRAHGLGARKTEGRRARIGEKRLLPRVREFSCFRRREIDESIPETVGSSWLRDGRGAIVRPDVTLQYLIFDFGKREANVDSAKEEKLAAGADVIQVNQALAFRVASAYYQLLTAQERLQAAQDTLRTAQTTQDAAEN